MRKSKDEVLFKPQPVRGFERRNILYIPIDTPLNTIGEALKKRSLKEMATPFGYAYLLKNRAVVFQAVGAPLAVIWLERFVVSGTEEILILGFCGALHSKSKTADPVIITEATSEEGTSRHYFPRKRIFHPSASLSQTVRQTLQARSLPYRTGSLVSTDAPFRETKSWLEQQRKKRLGFVDMEASAVFAMAEFHGIQAAALMLVTDNLSEAKHKIHFKHPRLIKNVQNYFFPFME